MPKIQYYISEKAYDHLVYLAQKGRFVAKDSNRVKGLSAFLDELSRQDFMDTRPPLVKKRHKEEESLGRAPKWLNVRQRRCRLLTIDDDSIERFFMVAYEFGIVRDEPYAVGGVSRLTPYPAVAFVLEAIGLQWITPDRLPSKDQDE